MPRWEMLGWFLRGVGNPSAVRHCESERTLAAQTRRPIIATTRVGFASLGSTTPRSLATRVGLRLQQLRGRGALGPDGSFAFSVIDERRLMSMLTLTATGGPCDVVVVITSADKLADAVRASGGFAPSTIFCLERAWRLNRRAIQGVQGISVGGLVALGRFGVGARSVDRLAAVVCGWAVARMGLDRLNGRLTPHDAEKALSMAAGAHSLRSIEINSDLDGL